jgi:hypothetical protein
MSLGDQFLDSKGQGALNAMEISFKFRRFVSGQQAEVRRDLACEPPCQEARIRRTIQNTIAAKTTPTSAATW